MFINNGLKKITSKLKPLMIAAIILCATFSAFADNDSIGQKAEWYNAKTAIMHTPGDEVFWGVIHPAAALFEGPFNLKQAQQEHKNYIKLLKQNGVNVYKIEDIILRGTTDENGNTVKGPDLEKLQTFAGQFLTIDLSALPKNIRKDQLTYKNEIISSLAPTDLMKIIFLHPIVHLYKTGKNTGYAARYELDPMMNLYFLRDQMITTGKGIVIGKFNSVQREDETKVIKFVLDKMGIKPIYEVTGSGCLEGGDFTIAKDVSFIGNGLRTNNEGVRQFLENKVFGTKYVVVVKDFWKNQDQMHLDCYFNIIGPDLAALAANRFPENGKSNCPTQLLKADVFELINDKYVSLYKNIYFLDYLKSTLKFKVIPVNISDQLKYGVNFLTISPYKILGIDGVSEKYKETLKNTGVDATWMDFKNLTKGYGAAHCTVQVIERTDLGTGNK